MDTTHDASQALLEKSANTKPIPIKGLASFRTTQSTCQVFLMWNYPVNQFHISPLDVARVEALRSCPSCSIFGLVTSTSCGEVYKIAGSRRLER